jgi:hypothetical protein
LGFGLRLVEPTARRGNWDVGTLGKFIVDMGGKVSNNKDIPLKTTFHYSTIPCAGRKQLAAKNLPDFMWLYKFRDVIT